MDRSVAEPALIALQTFVVAFLWAHDWIPLGRLNDVAAVRSQDTLRGLTTSTCCIAVLTISLTATSFSLLLQTINTRLA